MAIAIRRADRRTSVPVHIPRQTDTWSKLGPLLVAAGDSREPRIARVVPTVRRIRKHRASDSLVKSVEAEIFSLSADHVLRNRWFPAEAIIHGQSWSHLPCVR